MSHHDVPSEIISCAVAAANVAGARRDAIEQLTKTRVVPSQYPAELGAHEISQAASDALKAVERLRNALKVQAAAVGELADALFCNHAADDAEERSAIVQLCSYPDTL